MPSFSNFLRTHTRTAFRAALHRHSSTVAPARCDARFVWLGTWQFGLGRSRSRKQNTARRSDSIKPDTGMQEIFSYGKQNKQKQRKQRGLATRVASCDLGLGSLGPWSLRVRCDVI